jgi:hypothetical protein
MINMNERIYFRTTCISVGSFLNIEATGKLADPVPRTADSFRRGASLLLLNLTISDANMPVLDL